MSRAVRSSRLAEAASFETPADMPDQADVEAGPAAARRPKAATGSEPLSSVSEIAGELGVTARALRFYEDKGLIMPSRVGKSRVYSPRDRARMILILRGKRLGFSLRDIKDYLDLYDADPKRITQTRALLKKIETRRRRLQDQRIALDQALEGLKSLEEDALALLARTERGEAADPRASATNQPVATVLEPACRDRPKQGPPPERARFKTSRPSMKADHP